MSVAIYADRTGSDGTVQEFRKAGTTVGSIGTTSSNLYIGTGDTGIYFNASEDKITNYEDATWLTDVWFFVGFES